MRLDHLLSKEIIVIVCFVAGWVLVSAWLVTSFLSPHVGFMCGGKVFRWDKYRTWFYARVGDQ